MRDPQAKRKTGKPCLRSVDAGQTSRRVVLEALLGLGVTNALYGSLDSNAWRAYEAVEEAWIRDRHELLIQSSPAVAAVAAQDLDVKLADLKRRAIQFRHLLGCDPGLLRGGIWQMTALPVSTTEECEMSSLLPEYRKQEEHLKQLTEMLRQHPQYGLLQRAQMRLWKTPQYREIHRRYMGRMQELQRQYGGGTSTAATPTTQDSQQ